MAPAAVAKRSRTDQALGLLVLVLLTSAAAALGGAVTSASLDDWYRGLAKPPWTPPAWLFGPVWSALYLAMAVAAWLVWRRAASTERSRALLLWALQLALNVGWSALFFGLRSPWAASVEIVLLWCAIAATLAMFWRIAPLAGWLLTPYLIWVAFAAALNVSIWRLNA